MPLLKRVVWPPHVSRVPLVEDWVRDENGQVFQALLPATEQPQDLETFTNLTLANLISQLSSLSRHAEDLFGEMITESSHILNRTVSLQGRVDKLAVKVKNLDSNVEEVSLQDIHMRKAFKSSALFDKQVVSRETIPAAMLETYQFCEQPPPLQELNAYRDDGKDGLKFYTDPSYFFNLWRDKMNQETEQLKHDKKQKPGKKSETRKKGPVRQPPDTKARHRENAIARGDIIDQPIYHANPINQTSYDQVAVDGRPQRPNSIEVANHYQHTMNNGYPNAYSPSHDNVNNVPHGFSPSYNNDVYARQNQYTNNVDPNRKGLPHTTSMRPSQPPPAPPTDSTTTPPSGSRGGTPTRVSRPGQDRGSLPPPPLPPDVHQDLHHIPHPQSPLTIQHGGSQSPVPSRQGMNVYRTEPNLPPPPPTPDKHPGEMDPPPPTPPPPPPLVENNQPPPPPPPLPPPLMDNMMDGTTGNHMHKIIQNGDIRKAASQLKKRPPEEKRPIEEKPPDARSALLEAIRQGIDLRKVDTTSKPKEEPDASGDVAYILSRRMAFELSDTESSSDSDESEWGENGGANQP